MLTRKIFIGTENKIQSLNLYTMEKIFTSFINAIVPYFVYDNASTISPYFPEEISSSFKEDINDCELVLLDLSFEDMKENQACIYGVFSLFNYAIHQNKKVVIVHFDNPTYQKFYDNLKAKYPNIIGIFSHNGEEFPSAAFDCIESFYRSDYKYERHKYYKAETPEIKDIIENWFKESELKIEAGSFYHIYYDEREILINYEGNNTRPLMSLKIFIYELSDEEKLRAYNILNMMFDGLQNVFIHRDTCYRHSSDSGVERK